MMGPEIKAIVQASLQHGRIPELVSLAKPFHTAIIERFPLAMHPASEYLDNPTLYDPHGSGVEWEIDFDAHGRTVPPRHKTGREGDLVGCFQWCVALSYRGPLVAAFERVCRTDRLFELVSPTAPELIEWAQALATRFGLIFVDGIELHSWNVDADDMTSEMWSRLDYTDYPTAFQLLIEE